jgi:hypothetical protein
MMQTVSVGAARVPGDAREIITRLRAIPVVMPRTSVMRKPADRELLLSGLRLAAGEAD